MLYDSGYAANMIAGRWQPNTNKNVVQWARALLAEVQERREVHWVHVRGHSGDGGNDRADELVQWGKEQGPYARLRALGAGEGDSRLEAADGERRKDTAARDAARAGGAVRAGAARDGGAGGAAKRRRGDTLVKYGLIEKAELERARETLLADADALVARATNREEEGNSCDSDTEPSDNRQRGTPQGTQ
eukprot:SAG11_NODE_6375_length_1326_cov_2.696822_2_plen_190_part_00